MLTKLANWVTFALFSFHKPNRKFWWVRKALFLFPLFSILSIAVFNFFFLHNKLSRSALERRQAIVHFAGMALTERLDRLVDLGVATATRVPFRGLVQEGKWDEAMALLQNVPKDFPYVERIFLADPQGTEMADFPPLPGVVGQNFADRDWYQGVSREWQPYVSEVYKRAAEPRYNVVSASIPIKADDGAALGILVIQLKLETLMNWITSAYVGPSGFIYVVDQKGQVAAHPRFMPQGDIVDFSSVPPVQKALQGMPGVEVTFNQIENESRIVAYEQLPGYGWGVILQEPTATAFAIRDYTLLYLAGAYGFILLLNYFLIAFILRIFETTQMHRQQLLESQQRLTAVVETAQDAIVSADSDGNVVGWNKAAQTIFNYTPQEILGKPLTSIMPTRYHEQHLKGFSRYLQTREPTLIGKKVVKLWGLKKDGTEFPLELSLSTWTDDGRPFFTAILRDITWDARRNPA